MKLLRYLTLALFFVLAPGLSAQDSLPRGMTVSQYQCPQSAISDISRQYDSITRPVEDELVAEGLMVGAGLFFHQWGDEWNVNYYRLGQDQQSIMDAIAEVGRRVQARYPDAQGPGLFAECTAHKDNIYFWGPRTATTPGGGGQ